MIKYVRIQKYKFVQIFCRYLAGKNEYFCTNLYNFLMDIRKLIVFQNMYICSKRCKYFWFFWKIPKHWYIHVQSWSNLFLFQLQIIEPILNFFKNSPNLYNVVLKCLLILKNLYELNIKICTNIGNNKKPESQKLQFLKLEFQKFYFNLLGNYASSLISFIII